ncbi:phosphodiester glycosidase family protein [bacterium]|nr:phosphodiester glycosidase family protein [bacterium]
MKKKIVFSLLLAILFFYETSLLFPNVQIGKNKLSPEEYRLISGYLYVKLDFFEKLGYQVNYFENSKIILLSKDNTEVQLKVFSNYCWIDEECFISKLTVKLEDDMIWVPAYDVSGWLGYRVKENRDKIVIITDEVKSDVNLASIFSGKKHARLLKNIKIIKKKKPVAYKKRAKSYNKWKSLEKGVAYKKVSIGKKNRVVAHIIRIERSSGLMPKPVLAKNSILGKQTLSEIICEYDGICGINGSYFDRTMGIPLGLFVSEGKILSTPIYRRSAIGFNKNGEINMGLPKFRINIKINGENLKESINCVNQFPEKNGIMLYTSEYGTYTPALKDGHEIVITNNNVMSIGQGKSLIPPDGYVLVFTGKMKKYVDNINLFDNVSAENVFSGEWKGTVFAIGGGPRLVKNGKVVNTAKKEKFKNDIKIGRAPRSAIGLSRDGKTIFLVAVDGRQKKYSAGFTLDALAMFLKNIGCYHAINLDGGGSTSIAYRKKLLNRPSDRTMRKISNAIIITRVDEFKKYAYAY